jgi:hypothetical protein
MGKFKVVRQRASLPERMVFSVKLACCVVPMNHTPQSTLPDESDVGTRRIVACHCQ